MRFKFVVKQTPSPTSPNANILTVAEYSFDGGMFTIGSDPGNTIVLPGGAAEQAVVIREGESLTLINSAEGTSLNGRSLRREAIEPLAPDDEIRIGDHAISVVPLDGKAASPNGSERQVQPETPASNREHAGGKISEDAAEAGPREQKPSRNFADILNTLRTEEDSFYFIVESGERQTSRIPIEQSEMPLGFDAAGSLCSGPDNINVLLATVRKDWSGIVIEPQRRGAIVVNGEKLSAARRLRNDDRVNLHFQRMSGKYSSTIVLHEPNSLVALESLLETHPGNRVLKGVGGQAGSASGAVDTSVAPILERRFFGHFSFFEVVTMIVTTLIGAILVFVLLELTVG